MGNNFCSCECEGNPDLHDRDFVETTRCCGQIKRTYGNSYSINSYLCFRYHGEQTEYVNNKIEWQKNYICGYEHGPERWWHEYPHSLSFECTNRFGFMNGVCVRYYENGRFLSVDHYHYGELHGKSTNYYPNGNIEQEETYYHGLHVGLSKTYDPDGNIQEFEYYPEPGIGLYYWIMDFM